MTIQQFLNKIARGWWIILIPGLLGSTFSFYATKQPSYLGTITLGMSLNNQAITTLPEKELVRDQSYALLSQQFSIFLKNRLSSPAVEYSIGKRMNKTVDTFAAKKTFYTTTDQGLGYVTLDLQTKSELDANNFVQAVKDEYTNEIIPEWNNQRALEYQVKPMTNFVNQVVPVKETPQTQLLPIIAGLLIGVVLCTILPLKTNMKHGQL